MRPPLSKEVWFDPELAAGNQKFKQWNGVERSLFYEPDDFYLNADKLNDVANGGVSIVRGYAVTNINVDQQIVTLDDGTEIKYDKCLLATGVRPRSLEIFERVPSQIQHKIWLYKGLDDFSEFKKNVEKSHSVAIVGGGFLGSELACSLANFGRGKNLKVYQLFHEPGNMGKVLPEYLSAWTTNRVREEGVEVLPKSQVIGVKPFNGDKVELMLNDGKNVIVDHVIVAVGTNPNVELAKSAGLEVDSKFGGFVVNAELEARSNLFVVSISVILDISHNFFIIFFWIF
jgi:programmed cell death 8 (apoptosis-inducing factor)